MNTDKIINVFATEKGSVGKTEAAFRLVDYYEARGVPVRGYDLDDSNSDATKYRSDIFTRVKLGKNEVDIVSEIMKVLEATEADTEPVIILDVKAHGAPFIAKAIAEAKYLERNTAKGIGVTVHVFKTEDMTTNTKLDVMQKFFGESVQWVLWDNEMSNGGKEYRFNKTAAGKFAYSHGPVFKMPILTDLVTNAVVEARVRAAKAGKKVLLPQLLDEKENLLSPTVIAVFKTYLADLFDQMNAAADSLLPTELAEQVKALAQPASKVRKLEAESELNDGGGFDV